MCVYNFLSLSFYWIIYVYIHTYYGCRNKIYCPCKSDVIMIPEQFKTSLYDLASFRQSIRNLGLEMLEDAVFHSVLD